MEEEKVAMDVRLVVGPVPEKGERAYAPGTLFRGDAQDCELAITVDDANRSLKVTNVDEDFVSCEMASLVFARAFAATLRRTADELDRLAERMFSAPPASKNKKPAGKKKSHKKKPVLARKAAGTPPRAKQIAKASHAAALRSDMAGKGAA